MDYERSHNTSRRAPKLTAPAAAEAYGKLVRKYEETDELPPWRKTCATCGAYYAPYCYGIELEPGSDRELETPYTTEPDSWCSYWQREPKMEWNGRPCGRRHVQ